MQTGLAGLGKTGGNMRERLRQARHTVIGFDTGPGLSDTTSLTGMDDPGDAQPVRRAHGSGRGRRPQHVESAPGEEPAHPAEQ